MTVLKNISEIDFSKCSGCGACNSSCPVDAIQMKQDDEGFIYPVVNESCVNCGKCVNVCPAVDKTRKNISLESVFFAYSNDDIIRKNSSSGGVFYEFASRVLASGGVVFGAAMMEDCTVAHQWVDVQDDLHKLMKSKYIQSNIAVCYRTVKQFLSAGRKVLFSGTPCQIAGLHHFLARKYDNLITIDFVCHGVPSALIFREMIAYYEDKCKKKVKNVTFREKDRGWRTLRLKLYFCDGTYLSLDSRDEFFYHSFLYNKSLRKSCYFCEYPEGHESDITIADFWGMKDAEDKGISLVAVHTAEGMDIFDEIVSRCTTGVADKDLFPYSFVNHNKIPQYDYQSRTEFMERYKKDGYGISQKKMRSLIRKNKVRKWKKKIRSVLSRAKHKIFSKSK